MDTIQDGIILGTLTGAVGYLARFLNAIAWLLMIFAGMFCVKQLMTLPSDLNLLQRLANDEEHPERYQYERNAFLFSWAITLFLIALAVISQYG